MTLISPDKFPDKGAGENIIHTVDWSRAIPSDTIAGISWTATPASGAPTFSSEVVTGKKATVKIAGGTAGSLYTITCQMTTTTSVEIFQARIPLQILAAP